MVIIHVFARVQAGGDSAFRAATLSYGNQSKQEGGCIRFEVIQQENDPTRYVLLMVFKDASFRDSHFHTQHFREWQEGVAPLLDEELMSLNYLPVFPAPSLWES